MPLHKQNENKFKACMDLVDALLTTKQREMAIAGTAPLSEAKQEFLELNHWVKKATAAFENQTEVKSRRKAFWPGVGNIVVRHKMRPLVQEFVPRTPWAALKNGSDDHPWLAAGKNKTLREWIDERLEANKCKK